MSVPLVDRAKTQEIRAFRTADEHRNRYQSLRRAHWEHLARKMNGWTGWGQAYHRRLEEIYRFVIGRDKSVLEVGCGFGDLLASIEPAYGVGVDFSSAMVERARRRHPHLQFLVADAHELPLKKQFDYVVLSDLIHDVWDVHRVFDALRPLCTPRTRVALNFYSRVWELPLTAAEKLGLAKPKLQQNWLTPEDVRNLLELAGFELIRHWHEILLPLPLGPVATIFNRYFVKLFPANLLALTNFAVARPAAVQASGQSRRVSVIVPARNEEGNIAAIFERTPELGSGTELIFVEGHSRDRTRAAIQHEMAMRPWRNVKLLIQEGTGKGDAVRLGFAQATGDVLMILDADLTVPPEDLSRFSSALFSGHAEFVNGVRLVYPMGEQAMRFFNILGNKAFSIAFSWLLGQPIKDTLCGTKALWREDYDRISSNRAVFGDFDPFGDFDLLFGAAKLNLKIVDLPVRYRARCYGETNIQRWRHGSLLAKMVIFASRRVKFV